MKYLNSEEFEKLKELLDKGEHQEVIFFLKEIIRKINDHFTDEDIEKARGLLTNNSWSELFDLLKEKVKNPNHQRDLTNLRGQYNQYSREERLGVKKHSEKINRIRDAILEILDEVQNSHKIDADNFIGKYSDSIEQTSYDNLINFLDDYLKNKKDEVSASISELFNILKNSLIGSEIISKDIEGFIQVGETKYIIEKGFTRQDNYSFLFKARLEKHGQSQQVLLRVLKPSFYKDDSIRNTFIKSVNFQRKLNHEGILGIIEGPIDDLKSVVFAVLKYVEINNNLFEYIMSDNYKGYFDAETQTIFEQISNLIDYIHNTESAIRCIKPSDILLDEEGKIYIANFDSIYENGQPFNEAQIFKFLDPPYAAEWLTNLHAWRGASKNDKLEYSKKSDIFSLCVLLIFAIKREKLSTEKIINQITKDGWKKLVEELECSKKMKDFVLQNLDRSTILPNILDFRPKLSQLLVEEDKEKEAEKKNAKEEETKRIRNKIWLIHGVYVFSVFILSGILWLIGNEYYLDAKHKNTMDAWYYSYDADENFLETFPFLKKGSETLDLLDTLGSSLTNFYQRSDLRLNDVVLDDIRLPGGVPIKYGYQDIIFYPKKAWVLSNGKKVQADSLLNGTSFDSVAVKSIRSAINRLVTFHDNWFYPPKEAPKIDSSYMAQVLKIGKSSNLVSVGLLFVACYKKGKDSHQLMLRWPAYSDPNDPNLSKMGDYRFEKRPWWEFVESDKGRLQHNNPKLRLTKPYMDIREGMPPVRTLLYVDTTGYSKDSITWVLGVDLILDKQ